MKNKSILGLLLILALNASSCKKETSEGPQGAIGQTGATGNANVQSYSFVAYGSDWDSIGTLGQFGCGKIYTMKIPEITSTIKDSGFVFVYMDWDSTVVQLPWTLFYPSFQKTYGAVHKIGMAQVRCYNSDMTFPVLGLYTYFRVVVGTGTPKIIAPELNWNSYPDVSRFFHLE